MRVGKTLPRSSIRRFRNQLMTIAKSMVMVVIFIVTVHILVTSVSQQSPPLRPKTRIISNNESLCVHNTPILRDLSVTVNSQRSAVIMVLSARTNFRRRESVRMTYGSIRHANNVNILAVVFLLGSSNAPGEEEADLGQLETEIVQFGDIVMGDFVDTYRNLTRKSIMGYEWLTTFCREADFVVKTDDDVVVNIFKLTEKLNALPEQEVTSSHIWCAVHPDEPINTDVNSKFYVSPDEFPDGMFPTHCAGVGYVAPMAVIDRIATEISKSFLGHVCTHEDVFMTGVVLQKMYADGNSDSQKREPIKFIDTLYDWIIYISEDITADDSQVMLKLLALSENETINFDEYPIQVQKKFQTAIFFLLCNDIEERLLKFWQIIVKTFSK